MMKSEFCELTGTKYESITDYRYHLIELVYDEYPESKEDFCRDWALMSEAMRETVMLFANSSEGLERYTEQLMQDQKKTRSTLKKYRERVSQLLAFIESAGLREE